MCTICWSPHETSLLSRRTQAGRDWPVKPVIHAQSISRAFQYGTIPHPGSRRRLLWSHRHAMPWTPKAAALNLRSIRRLNMKPQLSRHRILSLCVIALCVFSGAWFGIHAEPQQDKVTQKLIGAWRLVSVEGTDPTFHFAYDQPTGRIIYDRSGWMAVQIDIKAKRKNYVDIVNRFG